MCHPESGDSLPPTMLELAPGVYSAPRLSTAVQERIWKVLTDWFMAEQDASIVLILGRPPTNPAAQSVRVLGLPPVEFIDLDGLLITHKASRPSGCSLTIWHRIKGLEPRVSPAHAGIDPFVTAVAISTPWSPPHTRGIDLQGTGVDRWSTRLPRTRGDRPILDELSPEV